ncbi:hypothetical protein L0337_44965 [candidate division KSB1 bacterium]|nr:hypothetical protein [candidate division KSB1 bacterium]
MKTLQITSEKEFGNLTELLDSLSEDYREFLTYWVEMKESPYSLEYVYARLFIFKGYFDRALAGLDNTSFRYPVAQKLNGRLQDFALQKALLDQRLRNFIQSSSQDEGLRHRLKIAADSKEANIQVETFSGRVILKDDDDLNSLNVLDAITALDDLRLYLDERKSLGLEIAFRLQYDQASLEERFGRIEKFFWQNLPILLEFRNEIKEYCNRFLILDDKKYPWWYPEKRKAGKKPFDQASSQLNPLPVQSVA